MKDDRSDKTVRYGNTDEPGKPRGRPSTGVSPRYNFRLPADLHAWLSAKGREGPAFLISVLKREKQKDEKF